MRQIETKITIDAPVENVWKVLMDFSAYGSWNPFITRLEGKTQKNAYLSVSIEPKGQKPMTFQPLVVEYEPYKCFTWLGHLWVKGIFDGRHHFKLKALNDTQTEFVQVEEFTGVLSSLLFSLVGKQTKAGFEQMNKALKQHSESIFQAIAHS